VPSFRSRFCRFLTKYVSSRKFNSQRTIEEMRNTMDVLAKLTGFPSNARVNKINIKDMPAEWIYRDDAPENRAVLYLHGGGYCLCSSDTHRELAAHISIESNTRVVFPDYRLAPESPYPAALEDSVMAYEWLLEKGFSPENIALAGDSAGGGLSIATAVLLREKGIPSPSSITCISPWVDLEMRGDSIRINSGTDPMLNLPLLELMASNYTGKDSPRNPFISPIYADLKGLPPLLIHSGSDEILLDDSKRLAEKAGDFEIDVTLKIYEKMWHVWHLFMRVMPESKIAIRETGLFIKQHFNCL